MINIAELLSEKANTPVDPIEKAKQDRINLVERVQRKKTVAIAKRLLKDISDDMQTAIFPYSEMNKKNEMVISLPKHRQIIGRVVTWLDSPESGVTYFYVIRKTWLGKIKVIGNAYCDLLDAIIAAEI